MRHFIPFLAIILCTVATAEQATFSGELIFPPIEKHSHGSSIVEAANGDLIACWFHGSGERQSDDVMVQGARMRKGEDTWSTPFVMVDTPNLPDCNPTLFIDPRGTLWLFWITVQDNEWGGSVLKYRTATEYTRDGAPEWSWQDVIHVRPTNLEEPFVAMLDKAEVDAAEFIKDNPRIQEQVDYGREQAKNKRSRRLGWMTRLQPIMTSENRMMLGLYSDVFNCSLAAFTEDWGKNWTFSEPIMGSNAMLLGNIQPAFVQRKNGEIMCYMRDNGMPKNVRTAQSLDNGQTWGELGLIDDIDNSGASVAVTALANGHWVMINNSMKQGRHIITAHLSDDEGATWTYKRNIAEREPDQANFSYPSVIQGADGTIHCTYSYREDGVIGASIRHVQFNEAWVTAGD